MLTLLFDGISYGMLLFVLGYGLQGAMINRVIRAPVLMTLTLTFGLDLALNNAMLLAFKADYRKVVLDPPLGSLALGPVFLPLDRVAVMVLALLLTLLLYQLLRQSRIGRAILAMRMDREAATLMGVDVMRMNAVTFGIGAFMAGAAGSLLSIIYPISPLNSSSFETIWFDPLGKPVGRPGIVRLKCRLPGIGIPYS